MLGTRHACLKSNQKPASAGRYCSPARKAPTSAVGVIIIRTLRARLLVRFEDPLKIGGANAASPIVDRHAQHRQRPRSGEPRWLHGSGGQAVGLDGLKVGVYAHDAALRELHCVDDEVQEHLITWPTTPAARHANRRSSRQLYVNARRWTTGRRAGGRAEEMRAEEWAPAWLMLSESATSGGREAATSAFSQDTIEARFSAQPIRHTCGNARAQMCALPSPVADAG